MGEHLEVDRGAGLVDGRNFLDRKLARKRDAIGTGGLAPSDPACVVDVRLGGDMRLDTRHKPTHLGEKAPVLDDERIRPQARAATHELECVGHFTVFDDDVDGHVHARTSEMRRTAGGLERLVGEVLGLTARVEGAHTHIDGIGAGSERRSEGCGSACGGEELG